MQPNRAQWRIIWIVTALLILGWPPDPSLKGGRSLGTKVGNWLADPFNTLAVMPDRLPIALDDDGDAVTAHDAQEAEYYRQVNSSSWIRLRMKLKSAADPFDATTERQVLAGIGILSVLVIWRLK